MDSFYEVIHFIIFEVMPYSVFGILLVASFIRWRVAPYTWKSQSSQILGARKSLNWGAILFHVGVILLFFGHLFGLYTPQWVFEAFHISYAQHQMLEILAGGASGSIALAGMIILFIRRIGDTRVRKSSRKSDFFVQWIILAVLCFGMTMVLWDILFDLDGAELIPLRKWSFGIIMFQPDAWTHMMSAPIWLKCHMCIGLCIFLIVPFTRLAHIWSGYLSPIYLFRPKQYMRINEVPLGSRDGKLSRRHRARGGDDEFETAHPDYS